MNYATYNARSAPPLRTWMPPAPQELQFYDNLFAQVDEQRRNVIGGQQAVAFFTRSHLDKSILREIWNIADSERKSELSRHEFYVAMRLISMAQRGEQMSVSRFYQLAGMPYPLPMIEGVAGLQQAQQPVTQFQAQNQGPSQPQDLRVLHPQQSSSSGTAYALTADAKSKYDAVFQQYDTDRDGFLLGAEAVPLFQMSGLDRQVLRQIWAMADVTQDSKLNIQEFYVAMHLIVCLSKRGLPMPPTLPRELRETAFGVDGAEPFSVGHGFGSQVAANPSNVVVEQQHEVLAPPEPEGMSAFDSLGITEDAPLPSLVSGSSQTNSFSHADASTTSSQLGGIGEPAGPPADNLLGGFPSPATATPRTPTLYGKDRANSTSSMNSFSSFTGLASLPPQQPAQQLPPQLSTNSECIQKQVDNLAHSSLVGDSFSVPKLQVTSSEMLFMGSDEKKTLVGQLDQQNQDIAHSIASLQRKQSTIETISEKLRCLDELRHELVTLSIKRENMRAAARFRGENSAYEQSRHFIERNLQNLVETQKLLVQQLKRDVARYEGELEEAILSAKLQQKVSLESRSPLIDAISPHSSEAAVTRATDFIGAARALETSISSIVAPSPCIHPLSPALTDTSGFNAWSNFDVAPRAAASAVTSSSPAPSLAQDVSKNDTFDVFGDFAAPPSIDVSLSLLPDVDILHEKQAHSPTPAPAAMSDSTGIDSTKEPLAAEDTAHPVPPAATAADTMSPFSPFSPSPSPAAGISDFGDFTAAPSSFTAGSNTEPNSLETVILSASALSTPVHEPSLFSPTPASVATEIPALDTFEAAPISSKETTDLASSTAATENLIFSPVAGGKNRSHSFVEMSADSAVKSPETASKHELTTNLLFSPTPSPPVATQAASFNAFDDLNPDPSDHTVSVSASEKGAGTSAFALKGNDILGFDDVNAAATLVERASPSAEPQEPAVASTDSPFALASKDDPDSGVTDFHAAHGLVATSLEAVKTQEATANALVSSVASSRTSDDFGAFASAPVTTDTATKKNATEASGICSFDSEFEMIDDFQSALTGETNGPTPDASDSREKSHAVDAFGDFHAASSSSLDDFGSFT